MKRLDQMATGAVLVLASAGALLTVAALFLEIGLIEAREQIERVPATILPKDVQVQGTPFVIPLHDDSVVCPIILRDGSLDPSFKYLFPPDSNTQDLPVFMSRWNFRRPAVDPMSTDYRFRRTWTMPMVRANDWVFGREIGLAHLDDQARVEGWLTEEGWSTDHRVAKSIQCFLLPALIPPWGLGESSGYVVTRGPVLAYATPDGLYQADLTRRKIEKVSDLENPTGFFFSRGFISGDAKTVHGVHPRCFILTPRRVHWIELAEAGRAGSFDRSEEMSGLEDSEVAPGTDGRMIVRRKVPGSPQDRIPRYHVWVFAEDGGKVTDYEYSIPNWSYTKISELPPSFWSQAVRQTTGGRLFQAVMTPSLSGICTLLTRYLHQSYGFQESVFDDLGLETSLWKSLPLSALLAVLVGASSRRRATTWVAPAVWSIFVLAFGLAAALVYAMLFGREWKTRCPGCAASISSQFITCPRCSAPAEEPRRLGIEIIQPSGPAPLK